MENIPNENHESETHNKNLKFLTFQIPYSSSANDFIGIEDDEVKYPILENNQLARTPPSPGRDLHLYRNQFLQARRNFLQQKSTAALHVFHYPEHEPNDSSLPLPIPILLIHGLASNKDMLKGLASCLHRKFGSAVASFDLRGHGESMVDPLLIPDVAFSIDFMLADILNVIRALRQNYNNINGIVSETAVNNEFKSSSSSNPWCRPILLIGHSYGANLALELACRKNRFYENISPEQRFACSNIHHDNSSAAAGAAGGGAVVTSLVPIRFCGCVLLDGGYIYLKRIYTEFEQCRLAMQPPDFRNMTKQELESIIRDQWCRNWSEENITAFINSFHFTYDNGIEWASPKLNFRQHLQLLYDLWRNPPTIFLPSIVRRVSGNSGTQQLKRSSSIHSNKALSIGHMAINGPLPIYSTTTAASTAASASTGNISYASSPSTESNIVLTQQALTRSSVNSNNNNNNNNNHSIYSSSSAATAGSATASAAAASATASTSVAVIGARDVSDKSCENDQDSDTDSLSTTISTASTSLSLSGINASNFNASNFNSYAKPISAAATANITTTTSTASASGGGGNSSRLSILPMVQVSPADISTLTTATTTVTTNTANTAATRTVPLMPPIPSLKGLSIASSSTHSHYVPPASPKLLTPRSVTLSDLTIPISVPPPTLIIPTDDGKTCLFSKNKHEDVEYLKKKIMNAIDITTTTATTTATNSITTGNTAVVPLHSPYYKSPGTTISSSSGSGSGGSISNNNSGNSKSGSNNSNSNKYINQSNNKMNINATVITATAAGGAESPTTATDCVSEHDCSSVCSSSQELTPISVPLQLQLQHTQIINSEQQSRQSIISQEPSPSPSFTNINSNENNDHERERERERVKVHWMRNCSHDAPITQPAYITQIIEDNMRKGFFNEVI